LSSTFKPTYLLLRASKPWKIGNIAGILENFWIGVHTGFAAGNNISGESIAPIYNSEE
jgi:hypothetical protein